MRARNRSERTIDSYRLAVNQLENHTGNKPIDEVTRRDVESYLADVLDKRASATARQRYASLKQWFSWLHEEGEVTENPMEKVRPPRVVEQPVPVLTVAEIRALLKACRGGEPFEATRDEALIRLFLDTGVRLGEMAGLSQNDIDFKLKVAIVTGKGGRMRTVPFSDTAAMAVDRYDRQRRRHTFSDRSAFWLGVKGPLTDSGISQVIARRSKDAGLERIHPHVFRHTFASRWLAAGGNEGDLQRIAGWESSQMLQRYGRSAADERARAAYRRIDLWDEI